MNIRKGQGTSSFENLAASCSCDIPCYCQIINRDTGATNYISQRVYWREKAKSTAVSGILPY